jgi:hypothetical protein
VRSYEAEIRVTQYSPEGTLSGPSHDTRK